MRKNINKKKITFIISCIISLVFVSVVIIQLVTPGILWLFTPKAKAKNGIIENAESIEHTEDVPEGEIRYIVNDNVAIKKGTLKGSFMFENPKACKYSLQFSVYEVVGDEKEDRLLYTSEMIEPGQFICEDKADSKMEPGEYKCIYFARAYLDGEYAGERCGDMTVTVY